jgi:protein O-GlcNAc transferase
MNAANKPLEEVQKHLRSGRYAEAAAACRAALEQHPNTPQLHHLLGDALESLGQPQAAATAYQQALQLDPHNANTLNNLALVWYALGQINDAANCYMQVIQLDPKHVQAHSNLGLLWRDLGRSDEAVASCRRALELAPGHPIVLNNLALAFEDEGLLAEAVATYREALLLEPGNAAIHSNLLLALNYDPRIEPRQLFDEHLGWARAHARVELVAQSYSNTAEPERPLRLGYVSPDFRSHPAVYFLEPLLVGHDRSKFQVVAYANVSAPDGVTARLQTRCDAFVNVWPMTDSQFADQVRADGIDILIDLAGHTGRNRLTLFAHKPAPVQVTYLGYQNTSGLASMDYRITDSITDPETDEAAITTEQSLHLDCGFLCFAPSANAPDLTALPALTNGYITFIASHRLIKVNDLVVDLWCRVLHALPTSRLVLAPRSLSPASMQRLSKQFAERGIDASRFEFQHRYLTGLSYLDTFAQADLMLDAFPTGAGTTACEAMWMGVPLITLRGNRYAGRMAASILTRLGLEQFIAESEQQYIDLAVQWSQRLDALAALRQTMRQRMRASPLCDAAGFVRHLEDAYRFAWRRWCGASA